MFFCDPITFHLVASSGHNFQFVQCFGLSIIQQFSHIHKVSLLHTLSFFSPLSSVLSLCLSGGLRPVAGASREGAGDPRATALVR